jgi:hypothetical protein
MPHEPVRYSYDAAGQQESVKQTTTVTDGFQLYTHAVTDTTAYDGDGQSVRVAEAHTVNGQPASDSQTTYQLRSTVLGGWVVSEYDAGGAWQQTYVYAGGERVGAQGKADPDGAGWQASATWRHIDPVTKDEVDTDNRGAPLGQTTLDPWGVDAGFDDPFPPSGGSSDVGEDTAEVTNPKLLGLSASPYGCAVDGAEYDCRFLTQESIVPCPNHDCGTRAVKVEITDRYGTQSYSGLTDPFSADAAGNSGFGIYGGVLLPDNYSLMLRGHRRSRRRGHSTTGWPSAGSGPGYLTSTTANAN